MLANRHELGRLESVVVVLNLAALGRDADMATARSAVRAALTDVLATTTIDVVLEKAAR